MIKQTDKALAEELLKNKLIAPTVLQKSLAEVKPDESLKNYLIRQGLASEEQLLKTLSAAMGFEIIDFKRIQVEKNVLDRMPVKFAWYYKILPVKVDNKVLTLATSNLLDVKVIDEIRVHLGLEPKVVLAKENDLLEAFRKYYGLAADTIDQILRKDPTGKKEQLESVWVEDLEKESQDASVAKLVNQIFLDAYQRRATDIHIEPYRDNVRLRYRIDGMLMDANLPSQAKQFLRPILSRIKIMANLSIEEKRLPQDGSAVVKTKDQDLDLRVSTIPTPRGESMVIRILPTKVMLYSLAKLGIEPDNLKTFRMLIDKPHGIIFVTGPTGSGKSTTLYACLNELSSIESKIVTIEDPIEFEMEGITQIQVNPKVNLDFARGLRSVLRHDPDIIMVGEVRDLETAEIAIRTALTGHLVFSSLHTNDAASGVTRLVDMGVEPFLVASSVEAFVAQRLVRIICKSCKEEVKAPLIELREEIAASLGLKSRYEVKIYRGRGCPECNNTGFWGRTAIYEILIVNESIREAILERKRPDAIKLMALRNGMRSLRQDGWRKVVAGVTTPEEVMDITVKDEIPRSEVGGNSANPSEKKTNTENQPVNPFSEAATEKNDYESRVYPRVNERVGVRFQIVKQIDQKTREFKTEDVEHATFSKDISAGGVRFVFGKTIPIGTLLSLKIQLKEGERSIHCTARVGRVEQEGQTNSFNVIAYYLDITSAERVKISNFVNSKLT